MLDLEVEVKFSVRELTKYEEIMRKIGAKFVCEQHQTDIYFQHPCRDFKLTDEALRIRVTGNKTYLTYKGARKGKNVKARPEAEVEVSDYNNMINILNQLGFKYIAKIEKRRRIYVYKKLIISFDDIHKIGKFIEIEIKEGKKHREYVNDIKNILEILKISPNKVITKSYLEMLLEKEKQK